MISITASSIQTYIKAFLPNQIIFRKKYTCIENNDGLRMSEEKGSCQVFCVLYISCHIIKSSAIFFTSPKTHFTCISQFIFDSYIRVTISSYEQKQIQLAEILSKIYIFGNKKVHFVLSKTNNGKMYTNNLTNTFETGFQR